MAESSLPNDAVPGRLVPAGATVPANRAPYGPLGGYGPGPDAPAAIWRVNAVRVPGASSTSASG